MEYYGRPLARHADTRSRVRERQSRQTLLAWNRLIRDERGHTRHTRCTADVDPSYSAHRDLPPLVLSRCTVVTPLATPFHLRDCTIEAAPCQGPIPARVQSA